MKKTQRILQLLDRIDELEKQLKEEREKNDRIAVNFTPLPSKSEIVDSFDFSEWLQTKGFEHQQGIGFVKDGFVLTIDYENKRFNMRTIKRFGDGTIKLIPSKLPKSESEAIESLKEYGIIIEPPFDFIEWLQSNGFEERVTEIGTTYFVRNNPYDFTYIAFDVCMVRKDFTIKHGGAGLYIRTTADGESSIPFPKKRSEAIELFTKYDIPLKQQPRKP